jgi:hypothetical protein
LLTQLKIFIDNILGKASGNKFSCSPNHRRGIVMSWHTEQLQARLQAEADRFETIVQVVESNSELYIYLNRPPQSPADCSELLPIIESTLKLEFPNTKTANIYSRELGEENPDWYTVLHLHPETPNGLLAEPEIDVNIDFSIAEVEQSIEPAVTNQEPQQQMVVINDAPPLSSFCFSRNRQLVENEIDRPSKEVSEVITKFHGWEKEEQIKLLQFLKEWFSTKNGSVTGLNQLSSEAREIVERMQADKELQRSLKIWFSRYCYDSQKTINEISGDSFLDKHSHGKLEQTINQDTTSGKTYSSYSKIPKATPVSKSSSRISVTPIDEPSGKISTAEIIQIVITAIIASGLTFLASDITLAFGAAGIFLFAVSVVGGFVVVFKQFIVGSTATALEIIGILGTGFSSIFVSIIGNLVGVAVAISVFMVTYNQKTLLTAKSLRVMIASLIAVTIALPSSSFIKVGSVAPSVSDFQASGTVVIQPRSSGSDIVPEQTFNIKGAVARLNVGGGGMGFIEVVASSQPISNEQLKLLVDMKNMGICRTFLEVAFTPTTKPEMIVCFIAYIDMGSKNLSNYDIAIHNPQSGSSFSVNPIRESGVAFSVNVSNIEPRRNGEVDLSLNGVVEREKFTAKVDVKFDTKILDTRYPDY